MTSILRKTVRTSAALLGALAVVGGASACGSLLGGEDGSEEPTTAEEQTEETTDEETTDEETTTEEETTEESPAEDATDEEGSAAGEPLTDEDLTAVGDRYYDFLQAVFDSDGDAACGFVSNPVTGKPLSDAEKESCAKGFEGELGDKSMDPSMKDALDRSMIEGVDNGDGTASVTMMGQDAGVTFIEIDEGQWYIDGSELI